MKFSKSMLRCAAGASGLALAAVLAPGLASAQSAATGPQVKLIVAQNKITVQRYGKRVYLDPGVYIGTFGTKLEFEVQRASYTKPLTISEIINTRTGQVVRPLPRKLLNGWRGLSDFVRMTVKNSSGKLVAVKILPFCPDTPNPERTNPNSPANDPFPQQCTTNPFELGNIWGLQRGWAADPIGNGYGFGTPLKLKIGRYLVSVDVMQAWRRLLHISTADANAVVHVRVVKSLNNCIIYCFRQHPKPPAKPLPSLANAPILNNPPKADLPDLRPLPSWNIHVLNIKLRRHAPITSHLIFGATVWIGGNAPLDVEGFRVNGSPTMHAFQYFWHDGKVVGRTSVGTMGFSDYNHWHFQQFAKYQLLGGKKRLIVRSQKEGFCVAPTDAIDLALPGATWRPSYIGLSGACGQQSALWTREMLPLGWGDTYFQYVPGQSFNITSLPNGKYFIEVIANPEGLLHETDTRNDTSLREIILGGTKGHRTVKVPAYHGIDLEK